jgi:hypothetical protein
MIPKFETADLTLVKKSTKKKIKFNNIRIKKLFIDQLKFFIFFLTEKKIKRITERTRKTQIGSGRKNEN